MSDIVSAKAIARGVDQAPRKVGLVASLVRGRSVADALVILQHTPKRAAKPVAKVIASAAANAVSAFGVVESSLVIDSLQVTSGPRLKRFRPIARGSANPFVKRTSHILVVVSGTPKPKKSANSRTTTKATASKEGK